LILAPWSIIYLIVLRLPAQTALCKRVRLLLGAAESLIPAPELSKSLAIAPNPVLSASAPKVSMSGPYKKVDNIVITVILSCRC
jgi:hypothetical protein